MNASIMTVILSEAKDLLSITACIVFVMRNRFALPQNRSLVGGAAS